MVVSAIERQLFCLPLQFGGLGVFNPVIMSDNCYDLSVCSTLLFHESILGHAVFELDAHVETKVFDQQHKKEQCAVIIF